MWWEPDAGAEEKSQLLLESREKRASGWQASGEPEKMQDCYMVP